MLVSSSFQFISRNVQHCCLQVRLRLAVFTFFILSIVLLFFVKHKSCRAFTDTWLGLLPLHVRTPSLHAFSLHSHCSLTCMCASHRQRLVTAFSLPLHVLLAPSVSPQRHFRCALACEGAGQHMLPACQWLRMCLCCSVYRHLATQSLSK